MMSLEFLVKNGVQFGHQSWRVCPKMMPYIWGEKNGIHLIDVSKTAQRINQAKAFLESVAAEGKPILWVGTKKAAQPVVEHAGTQLNSPYVTNRWIGGTLTNFSEVKKAIEKLEHYESLLEHSERMYTKKEYGKFRKIVERVRDNVGGIRNISWPIGAVVVVDVKKEQVAVKEALKMGIPVVALADTNADPSGIDYIIPGNDDISRAIRVVIDPLIEAVSNGIQKAEEKARQQQQQQEQEQQKQESQAASEHKEHSGHKQQETQEQHNADQQEENNTKGQQQEHAQQQKTEHEDTRQEEQQASEHTDSKQAEQTQRTYTSAQKNTTTKVSSAHVEKRHSAAAGENEPLDDAGEE